MRDIHYKDRWETIASEWPVMEQVTITRTVDGEESTETTHITKRHVVIDYIEATCRLFYNGLPLQHSFPTCLFNSGAVDDAKSFAKWYGLTPDQLLTVEAVTRTVSREYIEVPEANRVVLGELSVGFEPAGPRTESEWQVLWSSGLESGENTSHYKAG